MFSIVEPNARIDPWTMVIHLKYASLTDRTMLQSNIYNYMTSFWLHSFTIIAKPFPNLWQSNKFITLSWFPWIYNQKGKKTPC